MKIFRSKYFILMFILIQKVLSKESPCLSKSCRKICIQTKKSYTLKIVGMIIRLSDVDPKFCEKLPKVIKLFALEKVLIDVDLLLIGTEIQLIIIAPTWEVQPIGNETTESYFRTIDLSGRSAPYLVRERAKNGIGHWNKNGDHGLPGLPGGSSGFVFGVANEIINDNKLRIITDGGHGGKGQDGGNGVTGLDGKTYNNVPKFEYTGQVLNWDTKLINRRVYRGRYVYKVRQFRVYGKTGELGGRSGNGGVGGFGGANGTISIFKLSNSKNDVQALSRKGRVGEIGFAGIPGIGGNNGNNVVMKCILNTSPTNTTKKFINGPKILDEDPGYAPSGISGKSGANVRMRLVPRSLGNIPNIPQKLNEYKIYARQHLANLKFSEQNHVFKFYEKLIADKALSKTYDSFRLIEELTGLEQQFFKLNEGYKLHWLYTNLQRRIYENDINPIVPHEAAEEYRNIMRAIIKQVYVRLKEMVSLEDSQLKVKTNFLKELESDLIPSINLLSYKKKAQALYQFISKDLNSLEKSVKKSKSLITNVMNYFLKDLDMTLDQEMDFLLEEIVQLKTIAYDSINELNEKYKNLRNVVKQKGLLSILNLGIIAVGILNTALGIQGTKIYSAIFKNITERAKSLAEEKSVNIMSIEGSQNLIKRDRERYTVFNEQEHLVNPNVKIDEIVKMASNLRIRNKELLLPREIDNSAAELYQSLMQMIQEQGYIFEEQEKFVNRTKAETTSKNALDIIDNVWEAVAKYNFIHKPKISLNVYLLQENAETIKTMQNELNDLEKQEPRNEEKIEALKIGERVAKYLKTTAQVFQTRSESVISIMNDEKKMSEIGEVINEIQDVLDELQDKEAGIYRAMVPMMDHISLNFVYLINKRKLIKMIQGLNADWNVTDVVINMKNIFNDLAGDFKNHKDLNWGFKKVNDAFAAVVRSKNLLLKLKNKQEHMIFPEGLDLNDLNYLKMEDSKIKTALAKLNVAISYNEVNRKCREWISTFKQFMFPYAGPYLPIFEELDSVIEEKGPNFESDLITKITNLKLIITSRDFIERMKKNRIKMQFGGTNSYSRLGFYNWKKEATMEKINDILSGYEATLEAKLRATNGKAVKFNSVRILFTAKDSVIQNLLDQKLRNFNVTLVHHGDSTYKYKNLYYKIKNTETTYQFSYSENFKNITSDRDYMLSPYATWSIKLSPSNRNGNFNELRQFKGTVNLELVGDGQYYKEFDCYAECEKKIKMYYGYN